MEWRLFKYSIAFKGSSKPCTLKPAPARASVKSCESQDVANKQEIVEGQRHEINVKDYAEVKSLDQIL